MRSAVTTFAILFAAAAALLPTSVPAQSTPTTDQTVTPLEVDATDETAEPSEDTSGANVRHLNSIQRILQYGTAGSLVLTAAGGVITYLNLPTQTGDGLCRTGDPIFGSYGCDGFNTLHGIGGTLELALPNDPERDDADLFDDPAAPVHLGGMALLPLLGIVSHSPEVLGVDATRGDEFPRTVRTIHATLGVVTAGAYLVSWFLDSR
ncbi:MAG: hypothetical protein ABEK29_00180 [Bradymonadaceae bacterium]